MGQRTKIGKGASLFEIESGSALRKPAGREILEVEDMTRFPLPPDYTEFLTENNGAIPLKKRFEHNGYCGEIVRFLFLADQRRPEHEDIYMLYVISDHLRALKDDPDKVGIVFVPVAELRDGNYLALDIRENSGDGKVCVWRTVASSDYSPSIVPIADSFSEFLQMLTDK